jgi:hypothetical protein
MNNDRTGASIFGHTKRQYNLLEYRLKRPRSDPRIQALNNKDT